MLSRLEWGAVTTSIVKKEGIMKKFFLAFLFALLAVSITQVYAQDDEDEDYEEEESDDDTKASVNFSVWDRVIWTPIGYDGEDPYTGLSTSWGFPYRIGLGIWGGNKYMGFSINFDASSKGPGLHDGQFMWFKPCEWFQLDVGQVGFQDLRGDAVYGMWNWLRIGRASGDIAGEGFTFDQWAWNDGAILRFRPVKGLLIAGGYGIGWGSDFDWFNRHDKDRTWKKYGKAILGDNSTDESGFMHQSFFAIGYDIENILNIRAGLFAQSTGQNADGDDVFVPKVDVEVQIKAVENMDLNIGAKIACGEVTSMPAAEVNLFFGYKVSIVKINVFFGSMINAWEQGSQWDNHGGYHNFDGEEGDNDEFGFTVGGGISIDLTEVDWLDIDVRYSNDIYAGIPDDSYANNSGDAWKNGLADSLVFLVGWKHKWGPATFGIGFEGGTNGTAACAGTDTYKADNGIWRGRDDDGKWTMGFSFAIPVVLELGF